MELFSVAFHSRNNTLSLLNILKLSKSFCIRHWKQTIKKKPESKLLSFFINFMVQIQNFNNYKGNLHFNVLNSCLFEPKLKGISCEVSEIFINNFCVLWNEIPTLKYLKSSFGSPKVNIYVSRKILIKLNCVLIWSLFIKVKL